MTNLLTFFKKNKHTKSTYFFLSILSGILIGTSYIPFPAWAVGFCYLPLWYGLVLANESKQNYKIQFLMGWTTQFVLTLIGFNWICFTATEFGHLPPWLSVLVLLLFATFMHIYIPISAILSRYLANKFNLKISSFLILQALILSLIERIWPSIFEWNLGYTLFWMKWPIFQWADTIGFLGLSTLILLTQSIILVIILGYKTDRQKALLQFLSLFVFLFVLNIFGQVKKNQWSITNKAVSISVTQANVSNEEKIASELGREFQPFIIRKYVDTVNQYLQKQRQIDQEFKPDIILWPETALPITLDQKYQNGPLQQEIKTNIANWNSILVTGGYSQGQGLAKNSVFFYNQMGAVLNTYSKSQLLAFGEYIPFGDLFPVLYKILPFVGNFERGLGPSAFELTIPQKNNIKVGPQICYESLDPGFSRGLSNKNADLIFNFTNDSWYGDWSEPYQHLYMTLARAVENRRPLIRSTNTGYSSAVLANGTELERSPINQSWMGTYDIKYLENAPQSFYTKWGHFDWILILFFILIILLIKKLKKATK